MNPETLGKLRTALDPWATDAQEHTVTLDRTAAREILAALTAPPTVRLAFNKLGLDPADLGFDIDDEHVEVYHHDGAFLVVDGYDEHDPDSIRAVAEWFDGLCTQAAHAATELRDLANSICENCDGHGVVGFDEQERECPRCSGFGRVA